MFQLLQVLEYMHAYDIVHRDLKPENLLLTTTGELKVCDLGLARRYEPEMTGYLATRYYRAPEFMLTWRSYGPPVDIWSTGCILAELATGKILFPGVDHVHHLRLIIALIGSPPETVLSKICSPPTRNYLSLLPQAVRQDFSKLFEGRLGVDGVDLLKSMLEFDPTTRIAPRDALLHPFFKEVHLVCPPQPPTQFEPTIDECVDWRAKLLAELEHKA